MIPVFVLDRPASLRILQQLEDCKGEFGILAHPYTSDNFKKQFADFNLSAFKIGDSGIYQKGDMDYPKLFAEYEKMCVDYGIIKDYYRDPAKTLESAKEALEVYKNGKYNFQLMGVAQGNTVAEYVRSYKSQKDIGLSIVVIGGLLDKIENHVRMVKVKNETFLKNVLHAIRALYPDDKIFPLGVFNKNRVETFKSENIWASDYKGWIFRYNKAEADALGNRFQQTAENVRKLLKYINENKISNYGTHKKSNSRLLLVSCSKKKFSEPGKAINVYDGPYFHIIRSNSRPNSGIDIKIISAKYGLIDADDKIAPYDYKMTREDAKIYKQVYKKDLEELFSEYSTIAFCGSKLYASVMPENNAYIINARIGIQLHLLKEWLCNNGQPIPAQEFIPSNTYHSI